jgi:hypothetical protein
MNIALWIVTGILAVLYLFAGGTKAFTPHEKLKTQMAWVEDFSAGTVRFIGIAEILGAIGVVLPWLTGIAPILTPIAATGLVVIQALAIPVHVRRHEQKGLPMNIVLLLLALAVAVFRFVQFAGGMG